jgi:glycosyltransferase involved in cell wall biosynthesis
LKILIATHASLEIGGGEERMLVTLARALQLRGNEIRIANFSGFFGNERRVPLASLRDQLAPAVVEEVEPFPIFGRILPIPSPGGLHVLSEGIRWADVLIFGQYYALDAILNILAKTRGKPVVCSQANALFRPFTESPKDAVQEAYARTIGYRLLLRCDAVRVCNLEDLAFLERHGYAHGLLLYPLKGEFSAVTDLRSLPPPTDALAARLRTDNRFKVMVAGRMTHQKGVDLLADVVRGMVSEEPNLSERMCFYVAGASDLPVGLRDVRDRFPDLLINLGTLPRAVFPSFLEGADMVLVPSRYESFGMVAAEAQLFGKPVVATDTTGLRDVVADGKTGFLVREWSAPAFIRAIRHLMTVRRERPAEWISITEAAKARYNELFGPDAETRQFEDFVSALTSLARPRAAG